MEKRVLVNSEVVEIEVDSVCYQDQTFVRLSPDLIAGIIYDDKTSQIYLWEKKENHYSYAGDICFSKNEDGLLVRTYAKQNEAGRPNANNIAKQLAKRLGLGCTNMVEILSTN